VERGVYPGEAADQPKEKRIMLSVAVVALAQMAEKRDAKRYK